MPEWKVKSEPTRSFNVWVSTEGGQNFAIAEQHIQDYVDAVGLCVTTHSVRFTYTKGYEFGVCIGIRNYPRFPESREVLLHHAKKLGMIVADVCEQETFMIEELTAIGGSPMTYWYTRREKDQ